VDVKTIAYISQGKDLIKINKTMLFNPLNLSKNKKYNRSGKERCESNDTFIEQVCYENSTDESNVSIHLELLTPTYVYDLSRGSMMAKLEQHSHTFTRYVKLQSSQRG
jgi:hypothetical protein